MTEQDNHLKTLQEQAKELLAQKREIDEKLKETNRKMRDIQNNKLLIT